MEIHVAGHSRGHHAKLAKTAFKELTADCSANVYLHGRGQSEHGVARGLGVVTLSLLCGV
jgi:hypothetical protein